VSPPRPLPRRRARTRALELLFAADVRGADPVAVLLEAGDVDPFTRQLVEVVAANVLDLDAVIGAHAQGWAVDRMPAVDRTALRLAVAEMLHVEEVPTKVAIDEAVELVKAMSTDESPAFVNGVLASVARERSLL
jgi:transcription antitermination protein NusB